MNAPVGGARQHKCGWLRKQGGMVKSWHRRWFVLNGDYLFYFAKEDDVRPLGMICLPGNKIIQHQANPEEPDKFLFELMPGKNFKHKSVLSKIILELYKFGVSFLIYKYRKRCILNNDCYAS